MARRARRKCCSNYKLTDAEISHIFLALSKISSGTRNPLHCNFNPSIDLSLHFVFQIRYSLEKRMSLVEIGQPESEKADATARTWRQPVTKSAYHGAGEAKDPVHPVAAASPPIQTVKGVDVLGE